MKRILTVLLVLCMLSLSCALAESGNSDITIGYICANLTNQGWLIMNTTVQRASEEAGVTLKYMTAQMGDTSSWLACFEDLRNMEVDAILFGAADATLISTIEAAVAEGILCIEMDSPSGAKGTNVICIDNYSAAAQGAEWVGNALGGKGQVILINGDATYTSGVERRNGYYETLSEKYPEIEIFEVWSEGWTDENAMNGAEDALTALNEEADAIICCWDGATVVISSVLETRGLTGEVMLVGFDDAGDALSLMREGKIAMDLAQPFADLARNAVDVAVRVVKGESVDTLVLDATIVTPENCEQYIIEGGMSDYVK
ncbi:MAG: sugar ABC transporter substrate-binding protein [Clostridiales bacterium]|nr:sugar ABC transporter substrate-binding protein [Clostridiales bacterium]